MIIICPSCEKKFEVASNLIPENGRLLKCGACEKTWFYNKNNQINVSEEDIDEPVKSEIRIASPKSVKEKSEPIISKDSSNLKNNKGSELIRYQSKSNSKFSKFFNYLVVLIISFVALIIVLDTFKSPLSVYFPNLELMLYNFFETLKDLVLFIKDLN